MAEVDYFVARKNKRDYRAISSPTAATDYYLPSSGSTKLYGFYEATAYIYADTVAVDVVIEASLDGGTTFYEVSGYSIASGAFVTGKWNVINLPIKLTEVKIKVTTGVAAPDNIEIAIVAKIAKGPD